MSDLINLPAQINNLLYCHFPLTDLNWFYAMSSITNSMVNKLNFNICSAFHCSAHNFTNFIQDIAKYDKKE